MKMKKKILLTALLTGSLVLFSCGGSGESNSEFVSFTASTDQTYIPNPVVEITKDSNGNIIDYSIPQGKSINVNVSFVYLGNSNNPPNFIVKKAIINYGGYFSKEVALASSISSGKSATISIPIVTQNVNKRPPFLLANDIEDKTITLVDKKQLADAYSTYTSITTTHAYSDNFSLNTGDTIKPSSIYLSVSDGQNTLATCSDDGNGNMIGYCSGTVDYNTGSLNITWNFTPPDGVTPIDISFKRDVFQGDKVIFDVSDRVSPGENISNVIIYADGTSICDLNGNLNNGCILTRRFPDQYIFEISGLDKTNPVSLSAGILKTKHIDINSNHSVDFASPQTVNVGITLEGETTDGDKGTAHLNVVIDAYSSYTNNNGNNNGNTGGNNNGGNGNIPVVN